MSYESSNSKQNSDGASKPQPSQGVRFVEVDSGYAGQRIDNFLLAQLKGVPKTRIYRIIRKGEVRVNKGRVKPDYKIQIGDSIRIPPVRVAETKAATAAPKGLLADLEQAILYEDKYLMVINKPSGMAVHGGSGISLGLIEALRQLRPEERQLELVHRLDRDTSGCVMLAKKRSILKELHQQLRDGHIDKRYLALVNGRWPRRRHRVEAPLQKNVLSSGERIVRVDSEGQKSRTDYSPVETYPGYTLVEAKPITGRTHQIRVHCLHAGFPIGGDPKYGSTEANAELKQKGLKRLFLHAWRLEIPLSVYTKPLCLEAPLDPELDTVLSTLKQS